MPFEVAVQGVEPPTWRVQVFRGFGVVQREKLLAEPFRVLWLDPRLRTRPEKPLHALMPEAFYHLE